MESAQAKPQSTQNALYHSKCKAQIKIESNASYMLYMFFEN